MQSLWLYFIASRYFRLFSKFPSLIDSALRTCDKIKWSTINIFNYYTYLYYDWIHKEVKYDSSINSYIIYNKHSVWKSFLVTSKT